jgi:CarD family transcriptional regulator
MGGLFKKGEYIVYGTTGVCMVKDITTMDREDAPKEKLYYVLEPAKTAGGMIMTPVEGNKSIMRKVLTKEEAYELLDGIKTIDKLWVSDEKQRESRYREALKTCDCKAWIGIIKTLYVRKKDRMVRGKRLTEVDERYMKKAKENLQGELAITLGISEGEVERFILDRIGEEESH